MTKMIRDYSLLRSEIKTGDLIAVKGPWSDPLDFLIRIGTRSPYTHTGIAVWIGTRLVILESRSDGSHFALLSSLREEKFDVYTCPTDRVVFETSMWDTTEHHNAYNIFDLFRIIWRIRVKRTPPNDDGNLAFVCSGYSSYEYRKADTRWSLPTRVAPCEVVAATMKLSGETEPVLSYQPS